MSIIQGLIDYIRACPSVDEAAFNEVYVDLTSQDNNNLAVAASHNSIIKQYMDGSCLMEGNYVLFIKQYMGENQARLEHNLFLEDFMAWVMTQNRNRNYPAIGDDCIVRKIEAVNGMLYQVYDDDIGEYQVQIKITYVKK